MTAKEKAIELYEMFYYQLPIFLSEISKHIQSKTFAKFAADELIKYLPSVNGRPPNYQTVNEYCSEYWTEVKTEIEKL